MSKKFRGEYPPDWPEIAEAIKKANDYRCERCRHEHDATTGHVLTTHHLDGDKGNCARWNMAALCQRCHLHIQGRVNIFQFYMLLHTDWLKPHLVGFYQANDIPVPKELLR